MINFNLSVKLYVIRIFKDIFENEEINISTRPSIDKLYQKFIEESNNLLEQLKQSIKNIETYNIGESVFTTNENMPGLGFARAFATHLFICVWGACAPP